MKQVNRYRHQQRSVIFTALLLFNLVLVILQLWLFVSVLENLIDGHLDMAMPAAVASIVCTGVNVWMLVGIRRMERD